VFGRFRVLPHRRELLADGQPVMLGGRAYDVLMMLIEAQGAIVSKDALMARVWPDRVVEENALEVQVSAVRGSFGADRGLIRTVSGRGYQFTGEIRTQAAADERVVAGEAPVELRSALSPTNLPERVSEFIGRDEELRELLSLVACRRQVTLTGPGGIGKTRLALVAARELQAGFADGVWVSEFSPLADPSLVPATVAAAVGLELAAGEVSARRVAQALAGRRLLLVLDTCEHVIGAAAELAEAVLRAATGVHVLATSREPLRAEGEQIYPVPPLGVPADAGDDPWQYGAVQLFAARSRASGVHLPEERQVGLQIATACRQLDGIPLAIELAAARASALGIAELAALLDERFNLLTSGRRTGLARHRTLRATLDWSFELLSETERMVLRRLAIFAGAFSLEAAGAVASSADIVPSAVMAGLSSLVAKSLVTVEIDGNGTRYRLLDTMRAYAFEKVDDSGERGWLARRHAEYYRDLFERAEGESATRPIAEWLGDPAQKIDNVRAALDWTFSPDGDASIGVALTAAAIPLWLHLSLLYECSTRVDQALSSFTVGAVQDPVREMKLYAALGASSLYSRGAIQDLGAAWTKALGIAESLHDVEYQLRSLWGLWAFHLATGEWRVTLGIAERFGALAAHRPDPNERAIADRMIGFSQHYLGDQASARMHIERMLSNFIPVAGRSDYAARFQFDQRVAARAMLARILWLQGSPDQAMLAVESTVEAARTANAISMCYALALAACPIALWVADLVAAERYVRMLLEYSTRHALPTWETLGHCYQGVLLIRRGDIPGGIGLLRAGFDEAGERLFAMNYLMFAGEMAVGLGHAGHVADGLAAVELAIERCEQNEERWLVAELLRAKGELLLLQAPRGTAPTAEDHFRHGLNWARQQGAQAWELRASTSLAGLLRDYGRSEDAKALLQPVYDKFTEGFDAADLKKAREVLDAVR